MRSVWAISDLHLAFGVEGKDMGVFGSKWEKHHEKIARHWRELIHEDDLVLIGGDISWALRLEDAVKDLEWIDQLPGTKVMIKGNHDLWWKSNAKVRAMLPPSIHIIFNDAFLWNDVAIGGARLWETPANSYSNFIVFSETPRANVKKKEDTEENRLIDQRIYKKELHRLDFSLDAMSREASTRIVMLHYPPTGPDHKENEITTLMQNAGIDYCLYAHLHNLKSNAPVDFTLNQTKYFCTACDWLGFTPLRVC